MGRPSAHPLSPRILGPFQASTRTPFGFGLACFPVFVLRGKSLFTPLTPCFRLTPTPGKIFPTIGNFFPIIGKVPKIFSNHWKTWGRS